MIGIATYNVAMIYQSVGLSIEALDSYRSCLWVSEFSRLSFICHSRDQPSSLPQYLEGSAKEEARVLEGCLRLLETKMPSAPQEKQTLHSCMPTEQVSERLDSIWAKAAGTAQGAETKGSHFRLILADLSSSAAAVSIQQRSRMAQLAHSSSSTSKITAS